MCVRLSPLHFSLKLESATADEQAVQVVIRRGAHDQNEKKDKSKREKAMITYFYY